MKIENESVDGMKGTGRRRAEHAFAGVECGSRIRNRTIHIHHKICNVNFKGEAQKSVGGIVALSGSGAIVQEWEIAEGRGETKVSIVSKVSTLKNGRKPRWAETFDFAGRDRDSYRRLRCASRGRNDNDQ